MIFCKRYERYARVLSGYVHGVRTTFSVCLWPSSSSFADKPGQIILRPDAKFWCHRSAPGLMLCGGVSACLTLQTGTGECMRNCRRHASRACRRCDVQAVLDLAAESQVNGVEIWLTLYHAPYFRRGCILQYWRGSSDKLDLEYLDETKLAFS
jgi:hypothetical protein